MPHCSCQPAPLDVGFTWINAFWYSANEFLLALDRSKQFSYPRAIHKCNDVCQCVSVINWDLHVLPSVCMHTLKLTCVCSSFLLPVTKESTGSNFLSDHPNLPVRMQPFLGAGCISRQVGVTLSAASQRNDSGLNVSLRR